MTEAPEEITGTVYGVRLRGRLPDGFRPYLRPAGKAAGPTLAVEHRLVDALPDLTPGERKVWSAGTEGGGEFTLYRRADGFVLDVADEGRGRFTCSPHAIGIDWTRKGTAAPHYLVSYALPLWLEIDGVPVLHGSAVSLGAPPGAAVAFLGPSGVGKSVLRAELSRLGCGFVSDDGLALRRGPDGGWRCSHGPPVARLWPSGLERRLETSADPLPKVHETLEKRQLAVAEPGGGGDPALAALYVLERRREGAGGVEVSELAPRDGLVHLLEHGVAGAPAAALGLAARRLDLLADLAEEVPIRRLSFPTGEEDSARRILETIRPA